MIIVDTTVWVEFFRCHQPYFDQVSDLLSRKQVLALSPVFGELLQGAKNKAERDVIMELWNNLTAPSENELFLRAGAESNRNKWTDKGVGLIDSAIVVLGRETESLIWSLDTKLLRILKRKERYFPA